MSRRITKTRGEVWLHRSFRALSTAMALWIFCIFGSIHLLHNHTFLTSTSEDDPRAKGQDHAWIRGSDCCGKDGDRDAAARMDRCGIERDDGDDCEGNRTLKARIAPTSGITAGACPACTFLAAAKCEYAVHAAGIDPALDVCVRYSPAIEDIEVGIPYRTFDPRAPPPA